MKGNVAVLGAGSWGKALAHVATKAGNQVELWDRKKDLKQAVQSADLVVMAVPSHAFREILERVLPNLKKDAILLNSAKGLDQKTLRTLSTAAKDILGENEARRRFAVISGPSFADEVMKDRPTAVTVAAFRKETAGEVQKFLHYPKFHIFSSEDVVGVELAGALKNVMAIATGAVDGFGYGHNSRAGLITRGLSEITKIGQSMGANPITFLGLAGMGDLILTATGDLSRNRRVGLKLAQGKNLRTIMKEIGQCAEGIRTAKYAYLLAKELKVDAPILTEMYLCLYEKKPPQQAIEDLLSRPAKGELD